MGKKESASCCNVEAVVSFDKRGQLVLPKDLREKFKLIEGEKFAIVSCTNGEGELCCLNLIRTGELQDLIKGFLGPAFIDIMR